MNQKRDMIRLLDLTNPRHQQIVAEEIARAKRILSKTNRNESNTNNRYK